MPDFYLFANVNFMPGKYDAWQAGFDKLGKYVWAEEPDTKTYYFGIPYDYADDVSGTPLMFAFEVYTKKEALEEVHLKSPAMGTFLGTVLPLMSTGLDLGYYEHYAGFIDAPGDKRECGVMHDTRINCKSAGERDAVLKKLEELVQPVAEKDENIYTWLVARSLVDDKEIRLYSRFKTRDDMEKYNRDPQVIEFWKQCGQKEIDTMQQRGYIPNLKGWLHR